MYSPSSTVRTALWTALALVFAWRLTGVVTGLMAGNESALLAFPFAVIFPGALVVVLMLMPASETREGALMHLGVMIHLVLIIALPSLALYLALGFPVLFLVVEIFETRMPKGPRDTIAGWLVS